MGFYLETPRNKQKADQLVAMYNARKVDIMEALAEMINGKKAVICVAQNLNFDAAAYCYSLAELRRFNHVSDDRPKTWLVIDDKALVENLSGYTEAKRIEAEEAAAQEIK